MFYFVFADPANLKQEANKKAYQRFEKEHKTAKVVDNAEASQRFDSKLTFYI